MDDIKKQIIEAIEKGQLYDFIANNYYQMTKIELKDVLLEVIWSIDQADWNKDYLITCLSERWED